MVIGGEGNPKALFGLTSHLERRETMGSGNSNPQKRKIGWFCSYVPEEIIIAAGLEPVRLKGEVGKVKESDSYIFSNVCAYVKNILDSGLRNKLKNVEGIMFTNSCDRMRRLYAETN